MSWGGVSLQNSQKNPDKNGIRLKGSFKLGKIYFRIIISLSTCVTINLLQLTPMTLMCQNYKREGYFEDFGFLNILFYLDAPGGGAAINCRSNASAGAGE